VKPFLFLGTRAEDLAADGEYDALLRFSGLDERDCRRVRLERDELGEIDLDDWSGIVLGGGPFNVSDPAETKTATQHRVGAELRALAERVVESDTPFLGACYGIGTLGVLAGGVVDRRYAEPIGAVPVTLTEAGAQDRLTRVLPPTFDAFLGHKEAVSRLPAGAVLLASSPDCPVQAFRLGANVYATQFHPELDADGIVTRVEVYRHYGYFDPSGADALVARARAATVTEPPRLLTRFVELYAHY
jgi:GMP synthase (glutamine-hydrolysing)